MRLGLPLCVDGKRGGVSLAVMTSGATQAYAAILRKSAAIMPSMFCESNVAFQEAKRT